MQDTTTTTLGIGTRIIHPSFGAGVILKVYKEAYDICFMDEGIKFQGKNLSNCEIVEEIAHEEGADFNEAEKALAKIMKAWYGPTEIVDLGDKWENGQMILKPGQAGLKSKEFSIESFFHKIVMTRDRLRVMEQRINSSKGLSSEEKINLQQYITRIYGSLTTFNVLFKYKEDHFVGSKS